MDQQVLHRHGPQPCGIRGFRYEPGSEWRDERTEQNHQYWIFSDGTSWFEEHTNPAFPDTDHALSFDNAAPHFMILPNRLYSAAVWCFGSCDANGTKVDGASFAAAQITARMPFVVVAQSKN